MARKTLTTFLVALADSPKLRDKYRNPETRSRLLQQWGLDEHEAFQDGATLEVVQAAVEAEDGMHLVEWWILVDQAPVPNDAYNPTA